MSTNFGIKRSVNENTRTERIQFTAIGKHISHFVWKAIQPKIKEINGKKYI